MKNTIVWVAGLLCGVGLVAAESVTPETFLTRCGVYQYTNASSVTELTIRTNELRLAASDGLHHTSASATSWSAGHKWFVYLAKDMRVWAYDGDRGLWLLTAGPLASGSVSIEGLQEQPPAAVLNRLPKAIRKRLPPTQQPKSKKSGAANGSQPIRQASGRTSSAAGSRR